MDFIDITQQEKEQKFLNRENNLNLYELFVLAKEIRHREDDEPEPSTKDGFEYVREEAYKLNVILDSYKIDPEELKEREYYNYLMEYTQKYIASQKKKPTLINNIKIMLQNSKLNSAEKFQSTLKKWMDLHRLVHHATSYYKENEDNIKNLTKTLDSGEIKAIIDKYIHVGRGEHETSLLLENNERIRTLTYGEIKAIFDKYGTSNLLRMYLRNVNDGPKKTLRQAQEEANVLADELNKEKLKEEEEEKLKKEKDKEEKEAGKQTAKCPICLEKFDDKDLTSCKECVNRHKFHSICPDQQREGPDQQREEVSKCPTCRSKNIKTCDTTNDIFSGGKKKRKIKSFKKRRDKSLSTTQKVSGGRRCRSTGATGSTQKRKKTIRKKRKNKKRTRRFR